MSPAELLTRVADLNVDCFNVLLPYLVRESSVRSLIMHKSVNLFIGQSFSYTHISSRLCPPRLASFIQAGYSVKKFTSLGRVFNYGLWRSDQKKNSLPREHGLGFCIPVYQLIVFSQKIEWIPKRLDGYHNLKEVCKKRRNK
jgi:hypothetical protein